MQLMALDVDGGDVLSVTVPGAPKVAVGQQVSVTGLVALPWSQDGRSGIAFRAETITTAEGGKPGSTPRP
ncbi:regulatory protein [Mycobacterium intracellulare subsp. yongonense]|nr:regulatory protein [Mycobacterium intracellulare subsp. yongonense]ARR82951.1 regulatory protein [Mycobacterium intracellulare subsp. yongonense]